MSARYFCLRIVSRQVNLREYIRHRIAASNKIIIFLEHEDRCIQLARAVDQELCRTRSCPGVYLCMNAVLRDRLLGSAKCTEQVGGNDTLPAKSAKDGLVR